MSKNISSIVVMMQSLEDFKKEIKSKEIYISKLLEEKRNNDNLKGLLQEFIGELNENLECPIKYGMLIDPVITPYGTTYDRVWLERHLILNKNDPMTKLRLNKKNLIPNL
mmetsp:Transcript_30496/g.27015  ORF Transcript_30496/g.27015 Transcript_30496/m.27015 type:complete len:110 (+) Transcript_30496:491-820(+)|eukprot:CAMPEP_0205805618 /NCGR_PEP_ID=MMETSP0205-20121125/8908_1 /ASSEMBLY_ACC=CAM_ASM_000278 /TAXON_ID=36767 /ORGANISM="Euplotes focardii, Strain TN1" /LENGTH=109 /DNA_ID=CAMNT_0053077149 /DNA_START=469 /DNA_END=798 /DNA_ORIENTATION=-